MKCCERLHVLFYKYKQFFSVVIYASLQLQQYVMQHIELCPKYAADSRSFNDFNFLPVLRALWSADLIRAFQGLSRDGIHCSANLEKFLTNFIQKEGSRIEIVMQRYRLTHLESILASFKDGGKKVSGILFI